MAPIVTITLNPALDKCADIERVVPELKLRCHAPRYDPGGGGVNVSRVLKRLNIDSTAIFLAGGPAGTMLRELLVEEGVRITPIPIDGWTREDLTVREEASNLQYRFVMPGPDIQENEWRDLLTLLERIDPAPDYVVASGSLPPGIAADAYARIAEIAHQRGARIIVDTSGDALRRALEAGVFLVKPNLAELAALTGQQWIESEAHLSDTALRLIEDGRAEAVVVSLGGRGVFLATAEVQARLPALAVPVRSKVGAGDTLVAGVVAGLSTGKSLLEAVEVGLAASAATVMQPGTALCQREDVERLYAESRRRPAWGAGTTSYKL